LEIFFGWEKRVYVLGCLVLLIDIFGKHEKIQNKVFRKRI